MIHRKAWFRFPVLVLFAVTLAMPGAVLGAAETTTTNIIVRQPESFLSNPCNGDTIIAETVTHFLSHITIDEQGGFHLAAESNLRATGEGRPSGITYTIRSQGTFTEYSEPREFPLVITQEVKSLVIARGEDRQRRTEDDFYLRQLLHITINANGEVTSVHQVFESECR